MPSLRDTTHNALNWRRLGGAGLILGGLGLLVWLSVLAHQVFISTPRLLEMRHDDPVGHTGLATTQVTGLGSDAVPTLLDDIKTNKSQRTRSKSLELLSGIDDPRVVPTLAAALVDPNMGIRLAGLAGLARTGDPKAAAHLWPMMKEPEDMLRHRAIVALGLVADEADARRLLQETAKSGGYDKLLLAWAAGFALRRLELTERFAIVKPSPPYDTPEEVAQLQSAVTEVHAAIRAGEELEANARKLSELTTVSFSTWNYAHQIGFQTVAVRGPRAVRGLARIEKPIKPQPVLEGLKLKR